MSCLLIGTHSETRIAVLRKNSNTALSLKCSRYSLKLVTPFTSVLHASRKRDTYSHISPDTIRKIGDIILATYKYYDVAVRIADIRMTRTYVIYCLVPIPGVKKDAVCNLQTELSIALRTDVFMNVVYEKGYIGLFIATDYCRRFKSI